MKIKSTLSLILFVSVFASFVVQMTQSASPVDDQQGTSIAFASDRDGNYEIYSMNIDGTNVQQLTHSDVRNLYPDWSPDGSRIAFTSYRESVVSDIYIMDLDGNNLLNITNNATSNDRYPAWSPDGRKLAFSRMIGGSSDIYVVNPDGSGLTKVVDGGGQTYNLKPTWSPDGSQIMFTTANDLPRVGFESASIQTVNADGTNLMRISVGDINTDGNLDWSWANNTIAYHEASATGLVIYTVDVGMTMVTPITSIPEGQLRSDKNPSWSSDGKKIVYESKISGQSTAKTNTDIYIVDVTSGKTVNITPDFASEDIMPDWQPLPPTPETPSIASFILVDADTDEDIRPLKDGDTITEQTFTIRVNTSPATVGSVVFSLNDNPRFNVEDQDAYALKGDDNGDYHAWLAEPGTYTITATPYTEANGQGEAGTPLTITFTVEASGS